MNALSFIVGEPLMRIDDFLTLVCKSVQTRGTDLGASHMGAWRPKDSVACSLIKNQGQTLVYVHEQDVLYQAAPMMRLNKDCPDETAFLGHYFLENERPRMLIFDLIEANKTAAARYEKLRHYSRFVPLPICVVQWVGDVGCLTENFFKDLPHELDHTFLLHDSDPLQLCVPLRLDCAETLLTLFDQF